MDVPVKEKLEPHRPDYELKIDPWGRLVLIDSAGVRHVGVEPVRMFPITESEQWISLCDAAGHELVCLRTLEDLPEAMRRTVREALHRREFTPVIQKILNITIDPDGSEWEVTTDRGRTRFRLKGDDDIRRIGEDRYLIADAAGIRYLLGDARSLDPHSRRLLEHYI